MGVAVFLWVAIPMGVYWFLTGGDLGKSGQFGDMFGTVNALFSGLAFAAIAWTITLQQRQIAVQMEELQLQREDLKLQRKEMQESRGELAKQAKAQEAQTQVSIAQVRAAAYGAAIGVLNELELENALPEPEVPVETRYSESEMNKTEEMIFKKIIRLSLSNEYKQIDEVLEMHDKIHFELAHFEDSTDTNIILLMDLMRKVGKTRDSLVTINSITDKEIEDNIDDEDDSVNKDYVASLDKQHLMTYDLINNILWVVWDPLGVSQIDGSCNAFEYYCKDLLELKNNHAAEDMQGIFPEGFLFSNVLYGLAWADVLEKADKNSTVFKKGCAEIRWSIEEINSLNGKIVFPEDLDLPYGAFYNGWLSYLSGKYLKLLEKSEHPAAIHHHDSRFAPE